MRRRGNQLSDFGNWPFPHFHSLGAWRDGLREKKIPPRARVAGAFRNSRKKNFERRPGRIGQHQRHVKFPRAQVFADKEDAFAGRERNRLVHRRMMQPKFTQFFRTEQRDVRVGKFLAQPQQRGRGHHGVAQPVHAAHENPARIGNGGWRLAGRVFHLLSSNHNPRF